MKDVIVRDARIEDAAIFADVVVFDPATIKDRATYEQPHKYAVGVKHVFVNSACKFSRRANTPAQDLGGHYGGRGR
jgi:N-acyl-D-aspartate/D-glutamate deacylase